MEIEKIRGREDKFYALIFKFSNLIISRMNVTEVAFLYAVLVEYVDKLLHYKVAPNGRKMEKDGYWQALSRLALVLLLQLFSRIETEAQAHHFAVNYLGVIDLAHGYLSAFVGEPAASAADYPILNNICVVVENRDSGKALFFKKSVHFFCS